jgi:hypothetical protein
MGIGVQGTRQHLEQGQAFFRYGNAMRHADTGDIHLNVGNAFSVEIMEPEKATQNYE